MYHSCDDRPTSVENSLNSAQGSASTSTTISYRSERRPHIQRSPSSNATRHAPTGGYFFIFFLLELYIFHAYLISRQGLICCLFDLIIAGLPVPVLQNGADGENTSWYIAKAMLVLLIRLWTFTGDFFTVQVRRLVHTPPRLVHTPPPAMQSQAQLSPSVAVNQPVLQQTAELNVKPCLERLDRLESVFNQLMNKPPEIPREKDRVLMESFDRIKCIEHDLDKTKKVSFWVMFLIKFFNHSIFLS